MASRLSLIANVHILVTIRAYSTADHPFASQDPPAIYPWLEQAITPGFSISFPSFEVLLSSSSKDLQKACSQYYPRTTAVSKYLVTLRACDLAPEKQVEALAEAGISIRMLETFPEAVLAIMKDGVVKCQANPPTTWTSSFLELVGREDLVLLARGQRLGPQEVVPAVVRSSSLMFMLC
jgi:anaphase-promoting complex subunit 1